MSVRSHVQTDFRTEFSIIEGTYKNIRVSEHCRPSRQPLFGKELSQVKVSFVSCKDKDGLCEWIVFNSAKELYFYPFDGVGEVSQIVYVPHNVLYRWILCWSYMVDRSGWILKERSVTRLTLSFKYASCLLPNPTRIYFTA